MLIRKFRILGSYVLAETVILSLKLKNTLLLTVFKRQFWN